LWRLFFLAFVVLVYGVIPWEDLGMPIPTWWWWFPGITANFLFFGILIGIIGRLSEKTLVDIFVDGARDMLGVALIIGVARGITVIMNNGLITDNVSMDNKGVIAWHSIYATATFSKSSTLPPMSSSSCSSSQRISKPPSTAATSSRD
jgi:uncharacterized ion transporter superfamily protein YfcC